MRNRRIRTPQEVGVGVAIPHFVMQFNDDITRMTLISLHQVHRTDIYLYH